jgi:hypothetical protein
MTEAGREGIKMIKGRITGEGVKIRKKSFPSELQQGLKNFTVNTCLA